MTEEELSSQTLARVDERTKSIQYDIIQLREQLKDIDNINSKQHAEMLVAVDKNYTKKAEFDPIKKLVYGFVGFLLLSIGGMFIALITKQQTAAPPAIEIRDRTLIK